MQNISRVFKALSDSTRREILEALREKERPAGEIASLFSISAPSVSRHLSVLKAADLVMERRQGNSIIYQLQAHNLALCLNQFISKVCPIQKSKRSQRKKS